MRFKLSEEVYEVRLMRSPEGDYDSAIATCVLSSRASLASTAPPPTLRCAVPILSVGVTRDEKGRLMGLDIKEKGTSESIFVCDAKLDTGDVEGLIAAVVSSGIPVSALILAQAPGTECLSSSVIPVLVLEDAKVVTQMTTLVPSTERVVIEPMEGQVDANATKNSPERDVHGSSSILSEAGKEAKRLKMGSNSSSGHSTLDDGAVFSGSSESSETGSSHELSEHYSKGYGSRDDKQQIQQNPVRPLEQDSRDGIFRFCLDQYRYRSCTGAAINTHVFDVQTQTVAPTLLGNECLIEQLVPNRDGERVIWSFTHQPTNGSIVFHQTKSNRDASSLVPLLEKAGVAAVLLASLPLPDVLTNTPVPVFVLETADMKLLANAKHSQSRVSITRISPSVSREGGNDNGDVGVWVRSAKNGATERHSGTMSRSRVDHSPLDPDVAAYSPLHHGVDRKGNERLKYVAGESKREDSVAAVDKHGWITKGKDLIGNLLPGQHPVNQKMLFETKEWFSEKGWTSSRYCLQPTLKSSFITMTDQSVDCPAEILSFLKDKLKNTPIHIEAAKSAQQHVLILEYHPSVTSSPAWTKIACQEEDSTPAAISWQDALRHNRLVVRYWKGGSRWWNLHRKSRLEEGGIHELAVSEVAGYRIAKQCLPQLIPAVLHAATGLQHKPPWAILEYVGKHNVDKFLVGEEECYDETLVESMITVRDEYGFSEPHPRWGRVPVERCLDYALSVLREVIIPLHCFLRQQLTSVQGLDHLWGWSQPGEESGYQYISMIRCYKSAHEQMRKSLQNSLSPGKDEVLPKAVNLLGKCIALLEKDKATGVTTLPSVLVHMDLQPQNLLFAKRQDKLHISSVLDWEEAAYADPRFELLMLGRKVCATRSQAEHVWKIYETEMNVHLGSIDPWLKLETVHSISTLLLQSMDLLGGGRSPWETKPDLWGKIEREFHRLAAAGWSFCEEVVT